MALLFFVCILLEEQGLLLFFVNMMTLFMLELYVLIQAALRAIVLPAVSYWAIVVSFYFKSSSPVPLGFLVQSLLKLLL